MHYTFVVVVVLHSILLLFFFFLKLHARKKYWFNSIPTFPLQFEVMPTTAEKDESDRMSFHSAASQSPMEGMSPGNKFKDSDERGVFEVQLTQLQEQLVATMIDNQSLREWLVVECLFVFVSGNE